MKTESNLSFALFFFKPPKLEQSIFFTLFVAMSNIFLKSRYIICDSETFYFDIFMQFNP